MGYKLAGFKVLAANEIDPKMAGCYRLNHNPKHLFQCDIRDMLKMRLPPELYNLDILDGSPPCTTFSMAGDREKDWGKARVFTEGSALQILDELYFWFIRLAARLQPKIVVTENVEGILKGNSMKYVALICQRLDEAGYAAMYNVYDAADTGVPQHRRRFFLFGVRKDLLKHIPTSGLLYQSPLLRVKTDVVHVPFRDISDDTDQHILQRGKGVCLRAWAAVKPGQQLSVAHPLGHLFNYRRLSYDEPAPTLCACSTNMHPAYARYLNDKEFTAAATFPQDFQWDKVRGVYGTGMSVPPVMVATIADAINEQWLKPIHKALKKESRIHFPVKGLWEILEDAGIKFTPNDEALPGRPDAALHKSKIALFINSCFWHGCPDHFHRPKANVSFWQTKIDRNIAQRKAAQDALTKKDWSVIMVWEHTTAEEVISKIKQIRKMRKQ